MLTYCKNLLLATFLILCGAMPVFCEDREEEIGNQHDGKGSREESKELPIEDRTPGAYVDLSDGTRRYARLYPRGDYSRLKLIIRSVKKDYNPGESIVIRFFVRNDSESEAHLRISFSSTYFFHSWKLFYSNYDEVAKTSKGEERFQVNKRLWPSDGRQPYATPDSGYCYIKLQPGKEYEINATCLNVYFDLMQPDTYELTCFLPSFLYRQYYDPPLQSNTLTFRVLEEGEKSGVVEVDTNPPKGEEVFKQPKPPKNVFYALGQAGNEVFLDESPTTMAYRWAKERKAQADQPEE